MIDLKHAFLLAGLFAACSALAADERVGYLPIPGGKLWKEVSRTEQENVLLVERVPAGQTDADWKDRLLEGRFIVRNSMSARDFARSQASIENLVCDPVRAFGPEARVEGGAEAAYTTLYCGQRKGAGFGTVSQLKVIKGETYQYVIKRVWRVAPYTVGPDPLHGGLPPIKFASQAEADAFDQSQKDVQTWLIRSVKLCAPTETTGPCRPTGKTAAK